MDFAVLSPETIGTFLLAFARTAGIVFAAPVLSSRNVPNQVRFLLSTVLAMAILPIIPLSHLAPESTGFVPAMIAETALGAFLGFIGTLLFAAAELAGQLAGYQMGIAIANVLSPDGQSQISVMSQLLTLVALLVFVMSDAHHLFVAALVRSFDSLPLGTFVVDAARAGTLVRMGSAVFVYGLALAAPVLAVTLFITVALGILSRSMPQMDVFFLGFSVNMGAGLFVFVIAIPFLLAGVERLITLLESELFVVLRITA